MEAEGEGGVEQGEGEGCHDGESGLGSRWAHQLSPTGREGPLGTIWGQLWTRQGVSQGADPGALGEGELVSFWDQCLGLAGLVLRVGAAGAGAKPRPAPWMQPKRRAPLGLGTM